MLGSDSRRYIRNLYCSFPRDFNFSSSSHDASNDDSDSDDDDEMRHKPTDFACRIRQTLVDDFCREMERELFRGNHGHARNGWSSSAVSLNGRNLIPDAPVKRPKKNGVVSNRRLSLFVRARRDAPLVLRFAEQEKEKEEEKERQERPRQPSREPWT